MNEMQEAARRLHRIGFKTLPIKPGTKAPSIEHGVKDATADDAATDAWYAMHPNDGIGISGEGFVIFDFDIKDGLDGRDALLGWDLPDTLCQTTPSGGYHMIYRCGQDVHPSVNSAMAVDVRGWGSYVVCDPTPGYCWEDDCEPAEADATVMAFLEHVRPAKRGTKRHLESGDVGEGGRNDFLYREGCGLRAKNVEPDVIRANLHGINRIKCKPPLPDAEVDKIAESVLANEPGFSEEVKKQERRGRPRKFEHNKVARKLIDDFGACLIDGETPAIRLADGRYSMGWDAFDTAIIDMHDDCTESNRREVKAYVKARAPHRSQSSPFLMGFLNGVLDVRTMEFRDYGAEDLIPNVIPHNWNPAARSALLDSMLDRIACESTDTMLNLAEFIGMCMMRDVAVLPYFPVLIGEGSNGKSTYIKLLENVVGRDNISGLQPKEISAHFMGMHIVGKTANLGDDIANGYLDDKDCSVIKSVATGDLMFTDVKGSKGFHFRPYCTMVFSCNAFPRLADTTPGFMRRLFPVEFNAVFSRDDADFDPLIGTKLQDEEVLEYACVLGIDGLRRALDQNGPTPNDISNAMKAEIVNEANTGMQWINDENITAEHLIGMTKAEAYAEYQAWCERNGYAKTAMGSGTLSALFGTYFRLKCSKTDHREFATGRKSVKVYERKVP
jgi:putative DNA primase/helicase